jgi:hypothetical protein
MNYVEMCIVDLADLVAIGDLQAYKEILNRKQLKIKKI